MIDNAEGCNASNIKLVISDPSSPEGKEAAETLKKFKKSNGHGVRWLVSVDMVSEGVDIPSLRVLVYATGKKTQLYARQAWGRLIRVIHADRSKPNPDRKSTRLNSSHT